MRESIPWIMERLPDISDMRILNVGGIRQGKIEPAAEDLLKRGHEVFTVDIAAPDLAHFGKHYGLWDYCVADILDIAAELSWNSYDMVLAIHVLQHIGMPWHGLEKIINKKGDKIFASYLTRWLIPEGITFIETTIANKSQELKWNENTIWRIYTEDLLEEMFKPLILVDKLIYDGATDSRKRVEGARAIVMMFKKDRDGLFA